MLCSGQRGFGGVVRPFLSTAIVHSLVAGAVLLGVSARPVLAEDAAGLIAAHLAAGEFGPALALAQSAPAEERGALLAQVAAAQVAVGETDAAARTSRRIADPQARAAVESGLGGGAQANFGPLMNIITQNTTGEWQSQGDTEGGTMSPFFTGVKVDPAGVVRQTARSDASGRLSATAQAARVADLNDDLARGSSLRLVSLTRLERALSQRLEDGHAAPETMARLAGLSRIDYVFVYPEQQEVVIGGPASGWSYDARGLAVSNDSGTPTLQLEDLVTLVRAFQQGEQSFGCSINTREAGVKALKEYAEASQARGPLSAGAVKSWVNTLQNKLGRQDVVVWGVPASSRVARVLVEADYRMKLIGIDRLDGGAEVPSYFDLLGKSGGAGNASVDALRWWLTMQYDSLLHSEDGLAWQFAGNGVRCESENQFVTSQGQHLPTGKAEPTNRLFAERFTAGYSQLAERDAAFADARNVFSLGLVANLLTQQGLANRIEWNLGSLAVDGLYATRQYPVPKELDSVVNHRVYNGKDIVVQVAGGVSANPAALLAKSETSPRLSDVAQEARPTDLPAGRWWWDAAR